MVGVALLLRYCLGLIILTKMSVSMKPATFNRNSYPRPRVIEGFPDINNKYPYVVALGMEFPNPQMPFYRFCTGSIISSLFVITAAHCLTPQLQFVRCGNMTLPVNNSTCLSKVLEQIPHPLYFNVKRTHFVTKYNDIALLRIEKLVMATYGRLNFADYKTLMGRAVKYAGFGRTKYEYEGPEDLFKSQKLPLQIGEGVIYENDDKRATNLQLLVASKCSNRKQHAYSGDSGGPLLVDDKIVGVCGAVAQYLELGVKSHPPFAMYTAVSPYVDWIRQVITSNGNK